MKIQRHIKLNEVCWSLETACSDNNKVTTSWPDFLVKSATCQKNARGVGQGFVSQECAVFDIVLKTEIEVALGD